MSQFTTKYKYHFRPEYGSEKLLIEVFAGIDQHDFQHDFFEIIKDLKPKIVKESDLWMNDEVVYKIESKLGDFVLTLDIWGFAFIISEENQACLTYISELFENDERFEFVKVDYKDYK